MRRPWKFQWIGTCLRNTHHGIASTTFSLTETGLRHDFHLRLSTSAPHTSVALAVIGMSACRCDADHGLQGAGFRTYPTAAKCAAAARERGPISHGHRGGTVQGCWGTVIILIGSGEKKGTNPEVLAAATGEFPVCAPGQMPGEITAPQIHGLRWAPIGKGRRRPSMVGLPLLDGCGNRMRRNQWGSSHAYGSNLQGGREATGCGSSKGRRKRPGALNACIRPRIVRISHPEAHGPLRLHGQGCSESLCTFVETFRSTGSLVRALPPTIPKVLRTGPAGHRPAGASVPLPPVMDSNRQADRPAVNLKARPRRRAISMSRCAGRVLQEAPGLSRPWTLPMEAEAQWPELGCVGHHLCAGSWARTITAIRASLRRSEGFKRQVTEPGGEGCRKGVAKGWCGSSDD